MLQLSFFDHGALEPTGKTVFAARRWNVLLTLVAVLGVTGCSFLPSDGPSAGTIQEAATKKTIAEPYRLIPVTGKVIVALKQSEANASESGISSLAVPLVNDVPTEKMFRVTGMAGMPLPSRQTITAGDTLVVTIYEAGGGLFTPLTSGGADRSSSGGSSALPPQVVDESGQITVPFAGRIQVIGRTTYEIEQDIVDKLKSKTIQPQAIVTLTGRKGGDLVTVTGDVKQPALLPVTMEGTRLLDALTAAGGNIGDSHQTTVTVIRGSVSRSEALSDILSNVSKNIVLQPGDTVIVRNNPWTYLAFGAIGRTGTFPFGRADWSLAEAMAAAGGASDDRADPTIYLYRLESTKLVKDMGYQPVDKSAALTPVIYQLDLHAASGFFLAQRFSIRNKDIVYFSDADSVAVLKFFNVVNALTAPGRTGLSTAAGVQNIEGN